MPNQSLVHCDKIFYNSYVTMMEMERDCMIGHGTTKFLNERLFECSDKYVASICEVCGGFSTSRNECRGCQTDRVVDVKLPYVSKLVMQELNAMLIKTKITPKQ